MSTVFLVRAVYDIAIEPPPPLWNAFNHIQRDYSSARIPRGELLLARPDAGEDAWRIFPFPGLKRDWHPFIGGRKNGLGVRGNAVHVLLPLAPPPPVIAGRALSPSSLVEANQEACIWFLEHHEAITALLAGIAETVLTEEEKEEKGT